MAGKLQNVEAARGVAALLVVLYHADKYYFATEKYWIDSSFGSFFKFGHAGVEFFFVLSGFIMLEVHRRDIGLAGKVLPFLAKRFQRIYPFFWLVLLATMVMFYANGGADRDFQNPLIVLQSALLAGSDPYSAIVFVSWTLWHEVLFYAFCALVIAVPRFGIPAFVIWTVAGLLVWLTDYQAPWPPYLTSPLNAIFAMGVGCSLALSKWRIPAPRLVLASGIVGFVLTGLVSVSMGVNLGPTAAMLFGLASSLILLGAVESERADLMTSPRWLVTLGAASFAIYLVHMLILPVVAKLAVVTGLTAIVPPAVAFPVLVAAAVAGGLVAYFLVDRSIQTYLRRLNSRWPVAAPLT